MAERDGGGRGLARAGARFLRGRWRVLLRLAGWSLLESGQTLLSGFALARALDDGFLAGRPATGLGWLGLAGGTVLVGAWGTGRVYRRLAELAEPLRDALVRRVVRRGLREADASAVSQLTHQVEIARDTFAGVLMVTRSFVFTAAGALTGLFLLSHLLLVVVVPPLLTGLGLFAATLRPMARGQERFLAADEAVARELNLVFSGLRDIMAGGAEDRVSRDVAALVDAELAASRRLAWWGVPRGAALAVGGQLPVVLLVALAPWLLDHGVTAGAVVGALSYLTQSLLPALRDLAYGFGTGGSRLTVVLRRLTAGGEPGRAPVPDPAPGGSVPRSAGPVVELRSVTFAYGPAAEPVLRAVDLTVPAGEHLAVVGPSGIGKSTLTGLIAGLLEPGSGEVLLYGQPVRGPQAVRRRVLIPQEAYVFTGTLRDNLGYLRDEPVPDEELAAAVEAVGLGGVVDRVGGLDGRVGPGVAVGG